jgi:hypothetical protein
MKTKVDKWDCIKLSSFCTVEEIAPDWEKISVNHTLDKGLIPKYEELKVLNIKKTNNCIKMGKEDWGM